MFTGIITDLGHIQSIQRRDIMYLEIRTNYDIKTIAMGASIACHGVCLTVIKKDHNWFAVEASNETQSCTTVGDWYINMPVNLERPLKLGDELGGHLVLGHVDGIGVVQDIKEDGGNIRLAINILKDGLLKFIAPKGSIVVDGISLTINQVKNNIFDVNIIPATQKATNLQFIKVGQKVNLEIDLIARYLANLIKKE
ncbi:MAG: riboflavin synthase [Alphaproteobacteria bacterium]|nr:riboflavin synthase [Alphaproteobacteria bacterium]